MRLRRHCIFETAPNFIWSRISDSFLICHCVCICLFVCLFCFLNSIVLGSIADNTKGFCASGNTISNDINHDSIARRMPNDHNSYTPSGFPYSYYCQYFAAAATVSTTFTAVIKEQEQKKWQFGRNHHHWRWWNEYKLTMIECTRVNDILFHDNKFQRGNLEFM